MIAAQAARLDLIEADGTRLPTLLNTMEENARGLEQRIIGHDTLSAAHTANLRNETLNRTAEQERIQSDIVFLQTDTAEQKTLNANNEAARDTKERDMMNRIENAYARHADRMGTAGSEILTLKSSMDQLNMSSSIISSRLDALEQQSNQGLSGAQHGTQQNQGNWGGQREGPITEYKSVGSLDKLGSDKVKYKQWNIRMGSCMNGVRPEAKTIFKLVRDMMQADKACANNETSWKRARDAPIFRTQ